MVKNGQYSDFTTEIGWLSSHLEDIRMCAMSPHDLPTETAEAVSLARYRLERVAELLGCAQTKPPATEGCGGACSCHKGEVWGNPSKEVPHV